MDRGGVCIKFKENTLGKDIQNGPEGILGVIRDIGSRKEITLRMRIRTNRNMNDRM